MAVRLPIDPGVTVEPGLGGLPPEPSPGLPGSAVNAEPAISRAGLRIFVFGVLLIAGGFLTATIVDYRLATGGIVTDYQEFALAGAIEYFALGFGVVIATLGWILDRRAIDAVRGASSSPGFGSYATPGFVVMVVGALAIAIDPILIAIAELQAYQSVEATWLTLNLEFGLEIVSGVGIVVILIGWTLHHLAVVRWTEATAV